MSRREFSKGVRLQAWERCQGRCECGCGQKIIGTPEYDHIIEDTLTHDNSLENCMVMSKRCHDVKTKRNRPAIDKTRRILEKRAGVRQGRGFRGWRKMNGDIVWRDK